MPKLKVPFSHPFPERLRRLILSVLEDKLHPAYGQAATVDGRGRPSVRTVHYRFMKEYGTVGFNTHVHSPKWAHLRRKRAFSGCHLDFHRMVQLRWEGSVRLIPPGSPLKKDRDLLDRTWLLMRPEVRKVYWQDYGAAVFDVRRRCPNLGAVLCRPTLWDVFRMHPTDYSKGRRTVYELGSRGWRARRISLLHGGPFPLPRKKMV